jgi:hypothetical protein
MSPEMEEKLFKKLDNLERLFYEKNEPKPKQRSYGTLVKCSVIQELTGWKGSEKMRWARENCLVNYDKKSRKYVLESIHPNYLNYQKKQMDI